MIPATSPRELRKICHQLANKGVKGILISGGCNEEGMVPLSPFVDTIAQVKQETELVISVHTGLVGPADAKALAEAQIDVACVDVIGDDRTIQEILGLEKTTLDYQKTLEALFAEEFLTVPHVCLGLHYGKVLGVPKALEMSLSFEPALVVLLMLMPTTGTPMQNVDPPSATLLRKAIIWARLSHPQTTISLGCMRPRSERIDLTAVEAGINRIEIPRRTALKRARELGYMLKKIEACCSLPQELEN